MRKNYLDHDVKVRYMDGILSGSSEWQWFINIVESEYEIREIDSYYEFMDNFSNIKEIYSYLIRINKLDKIQVNYSDSIISEISIISKYFIGTLTFDEVNIQSKVGKLLLLIVWLTKLQNVSNNTDYYLDIRSITEQNVYKIINMNLLKEYEEELFSFIDEMVLADVQEIKDCLFNNLNRIEYKFETNILERYNEDIFNVNAFSYNSIRIPEKYTWEIRYILDMLNVEISNRSINPSIIFSEGSYPDVSLWTKDILEEIKRYLSSKEAEFIIETIRYVLYKVPPCKNTASKHFELVTEQLKQSQIRILSCSSFEIVSYLFEDKLIKSLDLDEEVKNLLSQVYKINDIDILLKLKNSKIPISTSQKMIISVFLSNQYKKISEVNNIFEMCNYLKIQNNALSIDSYNFIVVISKFDELIKDTFDLTVTEVFYLYMMFLIKTKENENLNRDLINSEMLRIQKKWNLEYFKNLQSSLQEITHEMSLPTDEVESANRLYLDNMINLARACMLLDERSIINIMERSSKYSLVHFTTRITLDSFFPIYNSGDIVYERHDIDCKLKELVGKLKKANRHKFLNVLEDEMYVNDLHKNYERNLITYSGLFYMEKELYEKISKRNKEILLIEFSEDIKLAHVTQLFPLLELKIREFAELINVVPFKENSNQFMEFKDPSSILREIVLNVYEEVESFENIPDLIFIYNFMYNSNSLNIRNDCIHAKKYVYGDSLKLALKTTLFSIEMISKRIELIKNLG